MRKKGRKENDNRDTNNDLEKMKIRNQINRNREKDDENGQRTELQG